VAVDPTATTLSHLDFGTSSAFHIFNNNLYFNEYSFASNSNSLFQMDQTGALTEVTDTATGDTLQAAGSLGGFVDFAGHTLFVAQTVDSGGMQLFSLDTSGDVEQLTHVSFGAFDSNIQPNFAIFDNAVYFDAYTDVGAGDGLFRVDLTGQLDAVD